MSELTHLDEEGRARMVDVGAKSDTDRVARVRGRIYMQPATLERIKDGQIKKGDVLGVANVAGIMAAKRTHELIPMCHPLMLTHIDLRFSFAPDDADPAYIQIETTVRTKGKTGVEMEALTATSTAALTIYDMAKAIDRGMRIGDIRLVEKRGGKSGNIVLE